MLNRKTSRTILISSLHHCSRRCKCTLHRLPQLLCLLNLHTGATRLRSLIGDRASAIARCSAVLICMRTGEFVARLQSRRLPHEHSNSVRQQHLGAFDSSGRNRLKCRAMCSRIRRYVLTRNSSLADFLARSTEKQGALSARVAFENANHVEKPIESIHSRMPAE